MLKKLLLCSLGLALMQCTQEKSEPIAVHSEEKTPIQGTYMRTPQEAEEAVRELLFNSEFRSLRADREIARVVDLSDLSTLRSTQAMGDFAQSFYAVEFDNNRGYALVSKDLRAFPVYAILDKGRADAKTLLSPEMRVQAEKMLAGLNNEIAFYEREVRQSQDQLRSNNDRPEENTENSRQQFLNDGWVISREAFPRLTTNWTQRVENPKLYLNQQGALFRDVYGREYDDFNDYDWEADMEDYMNGLDDFRTISQDAVTAFGCTTVAYGQVMYALRKEAGFKDLKYSSGEKVLWHKMDKHNWRNQENQRFLGWVTMNCRPTFYDAGTMIYNIHARDFLREQLGDNIISRYDNCVFHQGDLDGYGWSEDKKIAEEFFAYPNCFVIMTASSGSLNFFDYHTFVIDGMIEFKKRIKGSGFLGTGLFKKKRDGIRHLYHINAGWNGISNGYYLYVQNVNDEFKYTGSNDAMDYRSNVAYLIVRPRN